MTRTELELLALTLPLHELESRVLQNLAPDVAAMLALGTPLRAGPNTIERLHRALMLEDTAAAAHGRLEDVRRAARFTDMHWVPALLLWGLFGIERPIRATRAFSAYHVCNHTPPPTQQRDRYMRLLRDLWPSPMERREKIDAILDKWCEI